MISLRMFYIVVSFFFLQMEFASAAQYEIVKVDDNVYAAIAQPKGAASNSMFVVTDHEVILAGAHFTHEGLSELLKEIARVTSLPLGQIILTHHHKGYNYTDFDLPERAEVILSSSTLQSIKGEVREFKNPTVVFDGSLTLNRGKYSFSIISVGASHSSADTVLFIPRSRILFTSDLVFNDTIGFMGEASIHEWGENIDYLLEMGASKVIPGLGRIGDDSVILRFRKYYRSFMTEVIRNVEKGNTLAQTKKAFPLSEYMKLPGYETFFEVNLERAYRQFKSSR